MPAPLRPHPDARVAAPLLAALLVAVSLAPGCVGLCTTADWEEGMTVDFRPSLVEVGDGRYQIQVVADGVPAEVILDVAGSSFTCVVTAQGCNRATVELSDGRQLEVTASDTEVTVGYRDDRPAGGPRTLDVTVLRDGALLATQTYTPSYSRSEPNGRGCGVATTARGELVLE